MLVRVSGLLRLVGWVLETGPSACYVAADISGQVGLNQDLDALLWIPLLFCVLTRRFVWLFAIVCLVLCGSPLWPFGPARNSVA